MDEIYTFSRSGDYVEESKEYVSTQIPSYVWENCQIILKRIKDRGNQVVEFRLSNSHRELLVIDGEPTEFACNISQDVRRWRSSR